MITYSKKLIKHHVLRIGSVPDFRISNKFKAQRVWPDMQSHSHPIGK
jgi:hypothetical protein